jgi:hypothetical protein
MSLEWVVTLFYDLYVHSLATVDSLIRHNKLSSVLPDYKSN